MNQRQRVEVCSLPYDIWSEVLACCRDGNALQAFSLTSSANCVLARSYLFRDICANVRQDEGGHFDAFVKFITTHPYIGKCVRVLSLTRFRRTVGYRLYEDPDIPPDTFKLETLPIILSAVPRLQMLKLVDLVYEYDKVTPAVFPTFDIDFLMIFDGVKAVMPEYCPCAATLRVLSMFSKARRLEFFGPFMCPCTALEPTTEEADVQKAFDAHLPECDISRLAVEEFNPLYVKEFGLLFIAKILEHSASKNALRYLGLLVQSPWSFNLCTPIVRQCAPRISHLHLPLSSDRQRGRKWS